MVARASSGSKEDTAKFLIKASAGLTDEEYENLSMKDGIIIQKAVNEVNGLDADFLQKTPTSA